MCDYVHITSILRMFQLGVVVYRVVEDPDCAFVILAAVSNQRILEWLDLGW